MLSDDDDICRLRLDIDFVRAAHFCSRQLVSKPYNHVRQWSVLSYQPAASTRSGMT